MEKEDEVETGLIRTTTYFLPDFLVKIDQYLLNHYACNRVRLSRSNLITLAVKEYLVNHPVETPEPACNN